jgi:hypothetical protein
MWHVDTKQWENGGKRDVCANKVRLLVMQMMRKILTFNMCYNVVFQGANKAKQGHHNVLAMKNRILLVTMPHSVGHNCYVNV